MISSRLIKSNDVAAGCVDIVDAYDPFGDSSGLALYQLNGNATDVSANYNGNFINASYGTGVFGQAGVFAGTSSFVNAVDLPDSLAEAIGVNDFTFSLWINPTAFTYNGTGGIPISFVQPLTAYLQLNANGTITFARYDGTGYGLTSNISITTNSWYHIVAQQSSTDGGRLYINGSLVGQDSFNGNLIAGGTYQSIIGGYVNFTYANFWFQGSIDQTRIFNRALTPLEVEALYIEESCLCGGTVDTLDILEDSSCIATYTLDGNANDLSGNYSGTPTNVSYGVGEFDLAGVFNGNSSFINTNYTWAFTSIYSISFWAKTSTTNTRQMMTGVLAFNGADASGRFGFGFSSSNTFEFYIANGSSFYQNTSVSSISYQDNVWHNFIVVVNGTSIKLYVDGNTTPIANLTSTVLGTTSSDSLFIGRFGAYPGVYFNGSIDQVRIFNKALNSTEVTTLYNETACTPAACVSGTTNTLDILGDGSCIATYTLDGTPADLSGNYNGVQTDVTYPQGYFDLAGSFNGSSSVINVDSFVSTSVFAISFWLKAPAPVNWNSLIQSPNTDINSNQINTLFGHIGYFPDGGYNAGYIYVDSSIINVQDNNWHHIVLTCGGTYATTQIYIDGISRTLTGNGTLMQLRGTLNIGQRTNGTDTLNGQLDQVRIFNKALSAGEVTTLYNETPCN